MLFDIFKCQYYKTLLNGSKVKSPNHLKETEARTTLYIKLYKRAQRALERSPETEGF